MNTYRILGAALRVLPALLLCPLTGVCQEAPDWSGNLDIRNWRIADGLPQSSINCIAETPDGYLWLGTYGGLVRFDGLEFDLFDLTNTAELASNRIRELFVDRGGALWIGTLTGGVTRYADGRFTHYPMDGRVTHFVEDADGVVWAGGSQIWRFTGDRFEQVWNRAGGGVSQMWTVEGSARARTSFGYLRLCTDGTHPISAEEAEGEGPGQTAVRFGTWSVRVKVLRGVAPPASLFLTLAERGGFPANEIRSIHVDRNGQVWCGTGRYGLHRVREGVFERLEVRKPYKSCWFDADGEGGIWIGAANGRGVFRSVDGEIVERVFGDPAAPVDSIKGLLCAGDGTVWTRHGQYVTAIRDERSVLFDLGTHADEPCPMAETRDGSIWCGVGSRLCRIRDDELHWVGPADGLDASWRLSSLTATLDGALWVGSKSTIYRWDGERFTRFDSDQGAPRGFVRAICEASDGSFWIGADGGGLARFDGRTFQRYGVEDGLPDNAISCILDDGDGNLWMNCNHGVFSVRLDALVAHVPGISAELQVRLFETGEAQGPGGCFVRDGVAVFPVLESLVTIDTVRATARRAMPPKAQIKQFRAGGGTVALGAPIAIPAAGRDLEFLYTAPDLYDPLGLRFQHRLIGYDDDWVQAGARRLAAYTNVPAGAYTFEVVATNGSGLKSEPSSLSFTVEPLFHETPGFALLLAVLLVALAWGAYRVRTRAITAHNVELREEVSERTRAEHALRKSRSALRGLSQRLLTVQDEERRSISRELHDDVTQRLAALAIQTEVLETSIPGSKEGERQQARDVARMAQSLATDVQRLSRRLHPSSLQELGLARAMRSECDAFCRREAIAVRFDVNGVPEDLSSDVSLTVFRILQESLHNIEKHARSPHVAVAVSATAEELTVEITDAGIGFEPRESEHGDGIGLISMRERAKALGGSLTVESGLGSGTTVRLRVPLKERRA